MSPQKTNGKRKTLIVGVALIMVVALVAGWYGFTVLTAPPIDEFRLGVLLPLTGAFAAVAETQRQGILLAVDEINAKGGLWGKVKVVPFVADDEAKLDVGVRRYLDLVEVNKIHASVGQTWAPMIYAINEQARELKKPYFPTAVMAMSAFKKGTLAPWTYAVVWSPWTIGYMAAVAAMKDLGAKKIFFLARSDAWGWDMYEGVKAAVAKYGRQYGAEIIGYDEMPLGTPDFTPVLVKVRAAKPDVFIFAQFGADAVAALKQAYELGLHKEMKLFNAFITNVVAKAVPPEALSGVYALHYFYWDLEGFPDREVAESAKKYVDAFQAKWGYPPDAYATIAYIATKELFRAVELAGSVDAEKVAEALEKNPDFVTVKGPARWRFDHSPIYKYGAFLVVGKGANERAKGEWDLFRVLGAVGGEDALPPKELLGY